MDDILVIGGGIAGISAAARLSRLGRVTVLEQESALGFHASGRSAALYEPRYGKPSTVALSMASRDYHKTEHGGVLSPRGLMLVGTPDTADAFAHDRDAMGLDDMTLPDAQAIVPILNADTVDRVAWHKDAWDIDTDLLIQNFVRELRGNGGRVVTRATVTGITRTRTGWRVDVGDDAYDASMLVNAAGAWVDKVANMAGMTPLGFTPFRRSMARIPAPDGHDVSDWPMIFGASEAWYAKPDAGALIVSPAEEDATVPHDAYADDMVLAEGLARYAAHVTAPVNRLLASWAGLRTFAPDRQLVLGPSPQDATFIWCAGQGGYGFQTAPAASAFLADLIAGSTPELGADVAQMVSPSRFS